MEVMEVVREKGKELLSATTITTTACVLLDTTTALLSAVGHRWCEVAACSI